MSQYVKLLDLRQMLKAECRDSLSVGNSIDNELNVLLATKQEVLATQFDWASLELISDVAVDGQYATLPALNYARPVLVETQLNELWQPVEYGITSAQYNFPQSVAPIRRWKMVAKTDPTAAAQVEVWPIPPVAATIRFTGQQALLPLKIDDDVCTLDSLMLVLYVAADRLTALNQKDAASKLAQANAIAASLKSVMAKAEPVFKTYQSDGDCSRSRRRTVLIA